MTPVDSSGFPVNGFGCGYLNDGAELISLTDPPGEDGPGLGFCLGGLWRDPLVSMAGNVDCCAADEAASGSVDPRGGRGLLENPRGDRLPGVVASAKGIGLGGLEVPEIGNEMAEGDKA